MAEWVEGHVRRVLWASKDSGYAVIHVDTAREVVTAVGQLGVLADDDDVVGRFVALEGSWETHVVHGRQFRCVGFLQATPHTLEGLKLYLASSGIPGVGKALARRIVARYAEHTPSIMGDSDKLMQVDGIGQKKAHAIAERWQQDEAGRAIDVMLRGLGLAPRLVARIRERYRDGVSEVVLRAPYRLAEEISGVGFRTADAIARSRGLPEDSPARVRAAALYALDRASREGNCYLPRELVGREVAMLGVPTAALDEALSSAELDARLVIERSDGELAAGGPPRADDRIWRTDLYEAEREVALDLWERAWSADAQLELGEAPDPVDDEVRQAERFTGVDLDPLQREAVITALRGGVVVVTGGPGTGKTTLLRVLLRAVQERGVEFSLASPTGRAARRLAEATGKPASTLHRLLEYRPDAGGFQRSLDNPVPGHGLVIDEASMVDIELMHAAVSGLPRPETGFSLVLVGDADQLPSVGPGQVLRDVIASERVPVVRLDRIFRQAGDSGIVDAAAAIRHGRMPASAETHGGNDFYLLRRDDPRAAIDTVLEVVAERLPRLGFDKAQVLTPTRKGPLGTGALNEALQGRLNPDGAGVKRGDRELRVGDRVVCTRNRYDVEVFNGDLGEVVQAGEGGLVIDFDGRRIPWGWDELPLLDLAWAMTVHKSQGSEYPAVVLVLHRSHGVMLRRNLFYTAVSRAKRFVCVVGTPDAWGRAVRETGGDHRWTALGARLRGGVSGRR